MIEDCPEINNLVLLTDGPSWKRWYLPKLKNMSFHYMPKLVNVFGGEWISQSLEWLSFYDFPSLKIKGYNMRGRLVECIEVERIRRVKITKSG